MERSLKSIDVFVVNNDELSSSEVLNRAISITDPIQSGDQFVYSALATLTANMNWGDLSAGDKARWRDLLERAHDDELPLDQHRAYSAMGLPALASRGNLQELQFVAAFVGHLLGETVKSDDEDRAVRTISAVLDKVEKDAEQGCFTGYAWSPFAMAALLVRDFSGADLWPSIHSFLTHPAVSLESKEETLRILAGEIAIGALPHEVYERFQDHPIPVDSVTQGSFFSMPSGQFAAIVRKFNIVYGLTDPSAVQADILADMGSVDRVVRLRAIECCFGIAVREPRSEWPIVLLLQASHDRDGNVRHGAVQGLAYLSTLHATALAGSIADRVQSAIREPGIASVMGVLRGIASARRGNLAGEILWCRDEIIRLERGHPSRNVRRAAGVLALF